MVSQRLSWPALWPNLLFPFLESAENLGIETGPASSRGLVRMMLRWRWLPSSNLKERSMSWKIGPSRVASLLDEGKRRWKWHCPFVEISISDYLLRRRGRRIGAQNRRHRKRLALFLKFRPWDSASPHLLLRALPLDESRSSNCLSCWRASSDWLIEDP